MDIKLSEFRLILNYHNIGQPFPAGPGGVKSDFFSLPYFWNDDQKLFNASLLWNHSPGARKTESQVHQHGCEDFLQAPGTRTPGSRSEFWFF